MTKERTLIVIKPDGMSHADAIIRYYEKAGLKLVTKRTMRVTPDFAGQHYAATDEQVVGMGSKTIAASRESGMYAHMEKLFGTDDPKKIGMKLREWLIIFITSKPVLAMIFEGSDAVAAARKVTGFTDPARAEKGSVRGDLGTDAIVTANNEGRPVMNLVHASGNVEEAHREIALWFPDFDNE